MTYTNACFAVCAGPTNQSALVVIEPSPDMQETDENEKSSMASQDGIENVLIADHSAAENPKAAVRDFPRTI